MTTKGFVKRLFAGVLASTTLFASIAPSIANAEEETIIKADPSVFKQGKATLQGAEFTIYNKNDKDVVVNGNSYKPNEAVMTIVTDENGNAMAPKNSLPYGKYEVKETKAPEGYLLNTKDTHEVFVNANGITVDAGIIYDKIKRGTFKIAKKDLESNSFLASGASSLVGAQFEVINDNELPVSVYEDKDGKSAMRIVEPGKQVTVLTTEKKGNSIVAECNLALPYGDYIVKEINPSEGYILNADASVKISIREDGVTIDKSGLDSAVPEQVLRSDLKFVKKSDTGKVLAGVPFRITSLTTGESHVVVSDENGVVSTATPKHSVDTNGNDNIQAEDGYAEGKFEQSTEEVFKAEVEVNGEKHEVVVNKDKKIIALGSKDSKDLKEMKDVENPETLDGLKPYEKQKVEKKSYKTTGIWFSGHKDMQVPVNDNLGALPYDMYQVEEIRSDANYGHKMISFIYDGKNVANSEVKDENEKVDDSITLETTLLDSTTKSHVVSTNTKTTLVDTVTYNNLVVGKQYTLTGTLMDKATGEALLNESGQVITASKTFTAQKESGIETVEFTFNSSAIKGKTTVAFEKLFEGKREIASHADINDKNQTVGIPELKTRAFVTINGEELKAIPSTGQVKVNDVVEYKGITPGLTYTIEGKLLSVKDDKVVATGITTITPDKADGSATVEFNFNGSLLTDEQYVVFEELKLDGTKLTGHEDKNDKDQTVDVTKIKTTATTDNQTKMTTYDKESKFVDTVEYTNVIPGKKYTVTGTFHVVDENGKDLGPAIVNDKPLTSSKEFTPTEANGKVDVEFTCDTTLITGKKIVAFEELSLDKIKIAIHADTEDENQTLFVPGVQTKAHLTDGSQQMSLDKQLQVIDTVEYSHLIPGQEYTVEGMLNVKSVDGKVDVLKNEKDEPITSKVTFKADKANGTVDVPFVIDSTELKGKTVVVFEKLYHGETLIGAHEDINDTNQSVFGANIRTTATDALDNDKSLDGTMHKQTINDRIHYENLVVGNTYKAEATIMDKETGEAFKDKDGNVITGTAEFTPKTVNGDADVLINVDATELAGKQVVVFEKVYLGDRLIAEHTDLDDIEQTVDVSMILDVQIVKADSADTSKTLSGAEITIFDQDGNVAKDINGKNCIGTTGADGKLSFKMPYNRTQKLYAQETKSPEGYHINRTKYDINLGESNEGINVIKITVLDDKVFIPQTDDLTRTEVIIIGVVIAAALIGTGVYFFNKKKK